MSGLNHSITLSFLVVGHTKFTPDSCFGLLKQRFRHTYVQSLSDISRVVTESATVNKVQLVGTEQGEVLVPVYNWMSFFAPRLRKVPGIKQYHQFEFTEAEKGTVTCKQYTDSPGKSVNLLKETWNPTYSDLPDIIPPNGLSLERQWYLYDKIRPFCEPRYQNITCPLPSSPRPYRTPTASPVATPPPSPLPSQHQHTSPHHRTTSPPPKRPRTCGKCGEIGHNRRTCKV